MAVESFFVPVTPEPAAPADPGSPAAAAVAGARDAVDEVTAALEASAGRDAVGGALRSAAAVLEVAAGHYPHVPPDADPAGGAGQCGDAGCGGEGGWKEASHDAFFLIRRQWRSAEQWFGDRLRLFADVATKLDRGLFDRDAVLAITRFMSWQLDSPPVPPATARPPAVAAPRPAPDLSPMGGWKRGHHFLATACIAARTTLGRLESSVSAGDPAAAHADIALSTLAVRAVSASYELAGEFSATTYRADLRPLMCPPHTPIEMNGGLNLEYRSYLRQWQKVSALLREHRDDFTDGTWPPQLILPLETLFLTVAMEAHAHVTAAWRLVGSGIALHQHEDAIEGGVVVLHQHVVGRFDDYRAFVGL